MTGSSRIANPSGPLPESPAQSTASPADLVGQKIGTDGERRENADKLVFVLSWRLLDGWTPAEGTHAILYPGFYGPFCAVWVRGKWITDEDADLWNAQLGAEIDCDALASAVEGLLND